MSATKLAELWKLHAPSLRLLARVRCHSAEDCVQDAFVRLANEHPEPSDAHAWLIRVVRNLSIDVARSDGRRQLRERRVAREEGQWFAPVDEIDFGVSEVELEKVLRSMSEDLREIVVAHLWNGMSFRKIAEVFEIPASTAHRRYLEALDVIRTHLMNKCVNIETSRNEAKL